MAETFVPEDIELYLEKDENGNWKHGLSSEEERAISSFVKTRRMVGQTPDALRSGGLKVVRSVLEEKIREVAARAILLGRLSSVLQ